MRGHEVYADGLLGARLMPRYLALGPARSLHPLRARNPPRSFCSAWGGFGGELILAQLESGGVPPRLWKRFRRAVTRTTKADWFQGLDGAMGVLAVVAAGQGAQGVHTTRVALSRIAGALRRLLERITAGGKAYLGLAHGLAGTLCAYEQGAALLGFDEPEPGLRARAIEVFLRTATGDGSVWPTTVGDDAPPMHALCNGAPGIALGALVGWRASGDAAYVPLLERALRSIAVASENHSLCCGTLGRVEVLIEAHRTTGDARMKTLAQSLLAKVDPASLAGDTWQQGLAGYTFARRRLESPDVDLPGLPLVLPVLGGATQVRTD